MATDENQIQEKLQARMKDWSDGEGDDGDQRRRAPLAKPRGAGDHRGGAPRPSVLVAQPRMSVLGSGGGSNRRRSSIFLRRTSVGGSSVATLGTSATGGGNSASQAHLDALYKKAIRMNAENRINAANSWNLNLIEHIDKFVHDEEVENPRRSESDRRLSSSGAAAASEQDPERRVNFTKASCTLDASIKIYSYRVDDVHLTSYKVLANLNRNDGAAAKGKQGGERHGDDDPHGDGIGGGDGNDDDEDGEPRSRRMPEFKASGPTLESNMSNINMNKLDSAFDIDPLFHKMSKNFDEGGAKGLLLVNLGVGPRCNIVFDSSGDDDVADGELETPMLDDGDIEMVAMEHLTSKILSPDDELIELPLVPQLANLRAQLDELALEGFVDEGALEATPTLGKSRRSSPKSCRGYGANDKDEDEADVTIHQEAAERSVRLSTCYPAGDENGFFSSSQSVARASSMSPNDEDEYAPDDFGGGNDDYDDYGGTAWGYDDTEVATGFRPTSSPQADRRSESANEPPLPTLSSQITSQLLDKISSMSHVMAKSDYEFISDRMMKDNAWAGASFWKRKVRRKAKVAEADAAVEKAAPKKKASRKKKGMKGLDFGAPPDLSDILVKPKKNLLQWSRAVINKHSKEDNLLPLDVGFGVEQLSQLFLRPDLTMLGSGIQLSDKAEGFDPAVETWATRDDNSFGGGDDDDGPGFDFGGGDDYDDDFGGGDSGFAVPELKGVRKVEKVRVGYATVAKKVDVKRLKKDLWTELESHFDPPSDGEDENDERVTTGSTSFQTVVQDLESSKSQPDASLPFYFICMLHLANEKGLRLESKGLGDFDIYPDATAAGPSF